ncbi:hypothetical protein DXG03_000443 [Asterophora parasitica]|uniref:Paladin n=1 Tax=Asterophora parasitica TaxID=117018 RepID=A0A9P7GDK0_9AGAR|nr:hypothetical protein DXG03_000443 [Asterophora parasitica]
MIAATLVRRKQLIARGMPDPYAPKLPQLGSSPNPSNSGLNTPTHSQTEARILQTLEQANAQQDLSKSLLRLTYLLQQCLHNKNSQSAIELLMAQPALLENLRKAHMGTYGVILSLLGCLDHGLQSKKLVDRVIDATDQVTNLREDILMYRLKYSLTSLDEAQGENFLQKASKALEKYFFMIAFASYVDNSSEDFSQSFSDWLKARTEIWKDDVISELHEFGGRVLLHTETVDGTVVPVWEEVTESNVVVLKDVMAARREAEGIELQYYRVPITAERPPDFADLTDLIDVVLRTPTDTPIVVNCQLGRGRSTLASIILLLLRQWLEHHRAVKNPATPRYVKWTVSALSPGEHTPSKGRHSYTVINNLLRVIRKGPTVKNIVDDAVDQCSAVFNLRDSIEEARNSAEQATDEKQKRTFAHKGLQNLRRYFELIVFQSYLQSTEPDTMESFETVETFVKNRPVIKTFERELFAEGIDGLKPLERADPKDGVADPDEVTKIVANRTGSILSAATILKSDFFLNLQKMSLPERIEGSPNFRRVPLTLRPTGSAELSDEEGAEGLEVKYLEDGKMVCGSGMPTVDGFKRALERVDAGPGGKNVVFWTSLREEPVIYVAGRPHVLRLVDRPMENVEATGITTAVVEGMEQSFKKDVLREVRAFNGRVLLHDEVEERPGVFAVIPIWETVSESDILTPKDVIESIRKEGYRVDYARVAVTDEQAPLPGALWQLFERVRSGLSQAHTGDFVFNCQMGRGRTTTGMVTACLISSIMHWDADGEELAHEPAAEIYDSMDGPSEEEAYLQGEYKTILQLVGVLSHGKVAKRLADRAIDGMQDVQNLRKAIYDYKLKVEACDKGSLNQRKLRGTTVNYLYRYGTLIAFANYLIEMRDLKSPQVTFPDWLHKHREITNLLERRSLD